MSGPSYSEQVEFFRRQQNRRRRTQFGNTPAAEDENPLTPTPPEPQAAPEPQAVPEPPALEDLPFADTPAPAPTEQKPAAPQTPAAPPTPRPPAPARPQAPKPEPGRPPREEQTVAEANPAPRTRKIPLPPPTDPTVRLRLRVDDGPDAPKVFPLPEGEFVVGRAADVEVRLADDHVSLHHARVVVRSGKATIEDLKSLNGTRVNSTQLHGTIYLNTGDRIFMGRNRLTVELGERRG